MQNLPITTTVTRLQRNFNDAVREAEELSLPVLVISNSKPRGVYTPYEAYIKKNKQDDKDDLLSLSGSLPAEDADKLIKDIDEMFETNLDVVTYDKYFLKIPKVKIWKVPK